MFSACKPALGRNFTEAEDQPGGPHVVLVGYDFWQRNLGGREDVLGQSIKLDDAPYTIVGVMPKTFRHPYRAEFWLPIALNFAANSQTNHYLYGVARLRPGITIAQADAAARRMCAAINQAAPDPEQCAARLAHSVARQLHHGSAAEASPHRRRGPLRVARRGGELSRA